MEVGIVRVTEWGALDDVGIVEHGYDLSLVEFHNQCLLCNF
jgi:hypothetical protein